MKNILKMLGLFLVGVLMISVSYPISQTEWADGIRVKVQKIRQERRRMREQHQKSESHQKTIDESSESSRPSISK